MEEFRSRVEELSVEIARALERREILEAKEAYFYMWKGKYMFQQYIRYRIEDEEKVVRLVVSSDCYYPGMNSLRAVLKVNGRTEAILNYVNEKSIATLWERRPWFNSTDWVVDYWFIDRYYDRYHCHYVRERENFERELEEMAIENYQELDYDIYVIPAERTTEELVRKARKMEMDVIEKEGFFLFCLR